MLNFYKIKSITHTGTCGEAGTPRIDSGPGQHYKEWTGMTVSYDPYESYGSAKILHYIKSNTGLRISGWMHTSSVEDIKEYDNGDIELVTLNSVYYLEYLEDYE